VNPVRDDSTAALVIRARDGEKQAWDELIERYAPLIWSICGRYRLSRADADDVGQSVWLRLLEHLASLRDPAALPSWLDATTRRECGRVLRVVRRLDASGYAPSAGDVADKQTQVAEHELLTAERHAALLEGFAYLPPQCQQLIAVLIQDPPVPYAEISAKLDIPLGSIGPTRARCLDTLRQQPAIAALIDANGDEVPERVDGFYEALVVSDVR
jgi:RNA polymerase sigma factor (sigma-70 family)